MNQNLDSSNSNLLQVQSEEIESIQAIYCKPDEFITWEAPDGRYVTIQFEFNLQHNNAVDRGGLRAFIPSTYPSSIPKELNVFCDSHSIPVSILHSFELKLEERIESLKGEPMLLDLLCFVQELFETCSVINDDANDCEKLQHLFEGSSSNNSITANNCDSTYDLTDSTGTCSHVSPKHRIQTNGRNIDSIDKTDIDNNDTLVTALLQLDHMRAKQNYIKVIQKWTAELGLNGRLLFFGRFIFIILQGHAAEVKEYILRNKTMIVDVDSKGRPCKERMLSVLCEVSSKKHISFKDFVTIDGISNFDDFSNMFKSFSMMDVFKEYIDPVCSIKPKKSYLKK